MTRKIEYILGPNIEPELIKILMGWDDLDYLLYKIQRESDKKFNRLIVNGQYFSREEQDYIALENILMDWAKAIANATTDIIQGFNDINSTLNTLRKIWLPKEKL